MIETRQQNKDLNLNAISIIYIVPFFIWSKLDLEITIKYDVFVENKCLVICFIEFLTLICLFF